jgi:hypothetical protein
MRGIVLTILQLQLHLRAQVHSAAVYNIIKMSCHKIRTATASCRVPQKLPESMETVVYVVKPRT